jgi:hypothetical protein
MSEKLEKKEPIKYKLSLKVNAHLIGMKPMVLNTLGHICEAIFTELKDITLDDLYEPILLMIGSGCDFCGPEDRVKLQVGEKSIALKGWVQEMIARTIWGYMTSLKDIPADSSFDESQIMLEMQKKV